MEDTLRVIINHKNKDYEKVLILVLMEDTLRGVTIMEKKSIIESLNPCFNGRYSQRQEDGTYKEGESSLNPCFNGRYSQR